MSKFKLTQTAAEVQGILNNSLQKPTGLTKTKLVGVGVNGQENIEIGDNLTLANGKLSSAFNGLQSDAEGNLTASKNLGVDGKLTLKSLVSDTNPDGDITKELGGGGGAIHLYSVLISTNNDKFSYIATSTTDYGNATSVLDFGPNQTYADLKKKGKRYALSGFCYKGEQMCQTIDLLILNSDEYPFQINIFNPATKNTEVLIKGQVAATILKIS